MEPKTRTIHPKCFILRSLLCILFVAVAFRSEEVFEEGDPNDLFLLRPGSALGRYGRSTLTHVWGHEHFIPTKFRKQPQWTQEAQRATVAHL